MSKQVVFTEQAAAPIGPYSQAIRVGQFLYTSGQIPLDPKSEQIVSGGIAEQAHQSLKNLKAIVEAAGLDLSKVVKTTIFLNDMNDFAAMNEVYGQYFDGQTPPARSAVEVSRLPKDVLVEIEAICFDS